MLAYAGEQSLQGACSLADLFWKQLRKCLVSLETASMPEGSSACHLLCMWESEGLGLIIVFFFAMVDVVSVDQSVIKVSWARPVVLHFCLVYRVLSVPH